MANSSEYKTFEDLIKVLKDSGKKYDIEMITNAFLKAKSAHGEQKRVSGIPYIFHPISVAYILVELGMDSQSVAAALMHDILEDTSAGKNEIRSEFGDEIANLVDGVTKFKIIDSSEEEQHTRSIRKMLTAMSQDIRVIIIKLADRLNNMRTIECMPDRKRRKKSLENMELFVPIAHRLGIRSVKEELEDLSLKYLDPVAYTEIEQSLELKKADREKFLESIKSKIMQKLSPLFPHIHIEGRIKSTNGIYRKVFLKGRTMDEVYDIYAVRVIVDTVNDCYNALGIVHEMFNPIPNRFKDYISMPKPNMYQSLHTTVLGQEGIPFEVQIRTFDMHKTAEYGIAAHWKYKLSTLDNKDALEKCLSWVKKMVDEQNESEDLSDIVGSIKLDLAPEEVFVLTPKGTAITLPAGATVIDFAYAIHTEVGHRMIGAKVDKRIVPIDYEVKTGEIVEIITTKETGRGPSRDWLKIARTSEARNKIRQWFKREKREDNIITGRAIIEKEFKKHNISLEDKELTKVIEPYFKGGKFSNLDDFYAAIGYGGIPAFKIITNIREKILKPKLQSSTAQNNVASIKNKSKGSFGIDLDGVTNCLVKLANCCQPLPHDNIVGFITRGYGVSIHRTDCKNVPKDIEKNDHTERWIKATWIGEHNSQFLTSLEIISENKNTLLSDLTSQLYHLNVRINEMNSKSMKQDKIITILTISVKGPEQLNAVVNALSKVSGVISIRRTTNNSK